MEGGPGHGGAADEHRRQRGEGGGPARPPDADEDPLEDGRLLLGRELEGDGPPGGLAGRAHPAPLGEVVDLDDGAVDLVAEVVAGLEHGGGEVVDADQGVEPLDALVDRNAGPGQPLEEIPVGGDARVGVEGAGGVAVDGQVAAGGDLGVELAQGAGGGVAGVGEQPLPGLALAAVELGEGLQGHEHLAPHLDDVGRRGQLEPAGHRPDGQHVGGDVLAGHAVAPGGGPHQVAALVDQRDRQTVELRLAHEGHRLGHEALEPLPPRLEVGEVECVIKREHRHQVGHRAERDGAAGPLGRRVLRHQLGVLGLEGQEPPDELVVLGVGDLGLVELVVPGVVVPDQLPELFDLGLYGDARNPGADVAFHRNDVTGG